jgi:cellulose synthase/poly-beta-1,6-N-acetylglucosamine synthase-like glycosyltransferase
MVVAKCVGFLVGIVAVLSWFMILMLFRAIIGWVVQIIGVVGVLFFLALGVGSSITYGKISSKFIVIMLRYSCS